MAQMRAGKLDLKKHCLTSALGGLPTAITMLASSETLAALLFWCWRYRERTDLWDEVSWILGAEHRLSREAALMPLKLGVLNPTKHVDSATEP
jgi:hypothetical protein